MFSRRIVRYSIYLGRVTLHLSCPHYLVLRNHGDHFDLLKVNNVA